VSKDHLSIRGENWSSISGHLVFYSFAQLVILKKHLSSGAVSIHGDITGEIAFR